MPQNQGVSTAPRQSKAERRAAQRAAQLETFRKRETAARRSRIAIVALSVLGVLAVAAIVVVVIVVNIRPDAPPAQGVQTWSDLARTHVEGPVDYPMDPPAGGPHYPGWLNCGVYTEPQVNEQAVHSLEHGAVWVTYRPDLPAADVAAIAARLPSTYAVLSPYPGLDTPLAVSAWGAQLKFSDPADPAFDDFVQTYWRSPDAPEPTAPCTGAIDGPGKQ
jgi:hypothetical protein